MAGRPPTAITVEKRLALVKYLNVLEGSMVRVVLYPLHQSL